MIYNEDTVMIAFSIYTKLARNGIAEKEDVDLYMSNDEVRSLLERFAHEVDCVIVRTTEQLFLIPETKASPFHVSNEWIKKNYLRSDSVNADIYLLYFVTIILFGAFFDRYTSMEPTLDFISLSDWVKKVNERMNHLESFNEEQLSEFEQEYQYNWKVIIEKWRNMDDIKESAKRQTGNTISRLSFIDTAKRFLINEGLIKEIGNYEITLTEKAKTIVQRFFMDIEYNNNIFEFLYADEEEKIDAGHK